jgi:hypothetical protein
MKRIAYLTFLGLIIGFYCNGQAIQPILNLFDNAVIENGFFAQDEKSIANDLNLSQTGNQVLQIDSEVSPLSNDDDDADVNEGDSKFTRVHPRLHSCGNTTSSRLHKATCKMNAEKRTKSIR